MLKLVVTFTGFYPELPEILACFLLPLWQIRICFNAQHKKLRNLLSSSQINSNVVVNQGDPFINSLSRMRYGKFYLCRV